MAEIDPISRIRQVPVEVQPLPPLKEAYDIKPETRHSPISTFVQRELESKKTETEPASFRVRVGPPSNFAYMDFLFKDGELYKRYVEAKLETIAELLESERTLERRKELWEKAEEALHHYFKIKNDL